MKYNDKVKPLQCFMRQSTWYKGAPTVKVRGVCWHSTGANNPYLKRYVQPDDNAKDKTELLTMLGINYNKNDWNHIKRSAGVNAWIGKVAAGIVTTVQVGPWDKQAWGVGSGPKGSCNNGWIQFEICEDGLNNKAYFDAVYKEAVELTAYLCKMYNLDPKGKTRYAGMDVPIILCHQDTYRLGLGGDHADVYHWFKRYGKTMDDVRNDVAALLKEDQKPKEEPKEEEEEMTQEKFNEMMKAYRKTLQDNDSSTWSEAARKWSVENGLINGSNPEKFNGMWEDFLTREQFVQVLYAFAKLIGKA